jgi:excisionase family DNA binding protein
LTVEITLVSAVPLSFGSVGDMANHTPPTPPTSAFYTVAEVASYYGVSRQTIWREIRSGEIPAVRVGRCLRIPRNAAVLTTLIPTNN